MNFFLVRASRRPWRRVASFALAVALPYLSALANLHFAGLRQTPFALYVLSVALVTALGGLDAGLIASFCAFLSRFYLLSKVHAHPFTPINLVAYGVLIACAFLISTITVTRRRSAEELEIALSALQERTDALSESLQSGKCASWVFAPESGHFRWYSGSFQVFGRPFSEVEQLSSLATLLDPEDQPRLEEMKHHMQHSSEPFCFEFRTPWPNGELHWLEYRGTSIPGNPAAWHGLAVDTTDTKLAEAALLRSEKLAAMGRLASTVAHEINNPLEAVTNLLYLSRTDPSLSSETSTYLSTAEQELARLGDITRLTLGFVRTSESRRSVDVPQLLDEVLTIFRHRYEMKSIQIERRYQPNVFILTTPHELRQIATNLIANAVDAAALLQPRIIVEAYCDHNSAVVSVADNGMGIPPEQLPRIFEPFFTTKPDVGTGIGLWVTRELVEKNGGTIAVESGDLDDGMKTRFRIQFPLVPAGTVDTPIER